MSQLLALGTLVLLAVPIGQAVQSETLRGTLHFAHADFVGDADVTSLHLGAAYLTSKPSIKLQGLWRLQASEAVVNWTHQVWLGAGFRPDDPASSLTTYRTKNESHEQRFSEPSLSSVVDSAEAALLILPTGPVLLHASGASRVRNEATPEEKWVAGLRPEDAIQAAENDAGFLIKTYKTTPGQPAFRSESGVAWEIQGDIILYVWGANIAVADSAGRTTTYRSGAWIVNETGAVSREEHAQLLRITLTNATLKLQHEVGLAQWTAPESHMEITGVVQYHHAWGLLESALHSYEIQDESFQIVGTVQQKLTPAGEPSQLRSAIEAPEAQTNLSPSGVVPAPAAADALSAGSWVLTALLMVGATTAGYYAVRYGRVWVWRREFDRTQAALNMGRWNEALRHASRMVRLLPWHESGWLFYGHARLALEGPAGVIRDVEPAVGKLGRPAPVAFMLATAEADLGHVEKARKWAELATEDPKFVEDVLMKDPTFWNLMQRLRHRAAPDMPYA